MAISSGVLSRVLAFLTTVLLSSLGGLTRASAQTASSGSAQEHVNVVAHLALNGMHVNHMFVQQRDGKFYLYLHRPTKEAFALVDVTNPGKAVMLSRGTYKESPGSQVQAPAPGSVLAVTFTPEGAPAHSAPDAIKLPTETVQFVDMSNPKSAETVKTFKGVTSVYTEDGRKLVYLVNGEGLWIVSHHMTRPMPLCSSEDAIAAMPPDCQ